MPSLAFDHLAVSAATLEEGIAWVEERLGVRVPPGGRHAIMSTHNAVMSLGDGVYLEIIATDPAAGPAECPRWFALDDPFMRERLMSNGPMLATWITRSSDLAATKAAARADIGEIRQMSRGDLRWRIGVRPDGSMPMAGLHPICIEWPPGPHVSTRMQDLGFRFAGLTLRSGAPVELQAALDAIGAGHLAEVRPMKRGSPGLEARIRRPDGSEATLPGDVVGAAGDRCNG
jgi:hypothetical protein